MNVEEDNLIYLDEAAANLSWAKKEATIIRLIREYRNAPMKMRANFLLKWTKSEIEAPAASWGWIIDGAQIAGAYYATVALIKKSEVDDADALIRAFTNLIKDYAFDVLCLHPEKMQMKD